MNERHPDVTRKTAELGELRKNLKTMNVAIAGKPAGAIINTTFNMDIGETVVVGTSRLRGGDKALITLLTAVARGKSTREE